MRCRTNSGKGEGSWARIMSVIAIMNPVLRSHVEEKLTAVDHLPKASRVPSQPIPQNDPPRSPFAVIWPLALPWLRLPALSFNPGNRREARA